MKRNSAVVAAGVAIILLLLTTAGIYYFAGQDYLSDDISMTPTPTTVDLQTPSPSPELTRTQRVPQNWESYSPENDSYIIYHPPEMNISETAVGSIEFQMLGDTQPEQGTEIIDGIRLVIETGEYEEESFVAFVESEHMRMSDDPTTDEIIPMQLDEIAGKNAYWFNVTSLGENTHVYFPLDNDQFLHAFYLIEDPNDEGYQDIVDMMLNNLEM